MDKAHPKIHVEMQQTQHSKTNLRKNKIGELTLSNYRLTTKLQ